MGIDSPGVVAGVTLVPPVGALGKVAEIVLGVPFWEVSRARRDLANGVSEIMDSPGKGKGAKEKGQRKRPLRGGPAFYPNTGVVSLKFIS